MKAVGVFPGKANSVHLTEIPEPSLSDIPNGRGVLVKVLRVGVDGTAVTTSPVRMRGTGPECSRDSARLYGHCGLEKIINTATERAVERMSPRRHQRAAKLIT